MKSWRLTWRLQKNASEERQWEQRLKLLKGQYVKDDGKVRSAGHLPVKSSGTEWSQAKRQSKLVTFLMLLKKHHGQDHLEKRGLILGMWLQRGYSPSIRIQFQIKSPGEWRQCNLKGPGLWIMQGYSYFCTQSLFNGGCGWEDWKIFPRTALAFYSFRKNRSV